MYIKKKKILGQFEVFDKLLVYLGYFCFFENRGEELYLGSIKVGLSREVRYYWNRCIMEINMCSYKQQLVEYLKFFRDGMVFLNKDGFYFKK